MKFSVSVIIPAYNCDLFIEKAINSVLLQPEVVEIIVVNDGSRDKTQNILENLQKQNPIIKIYYHQNNKNRGRAASRNLGIKKSKGNYVAFLDADDFYLENRFVLDKKIFETNKDADGVYNAVGFCFYRELTSVEEQELTLNTVNQIINPEALFEALISGKHGHFQIDGLTVKKAIFDFTGFFNETLVVAEDTDIFWKMAIKAKLYTGVIDYPLALRGVHNSNVFNRDDLYKEYTIKMYESLIFWSSKNKVSIAIADTLFKWIWLITYKQKNTLINYIKYWSYLFINTPRFLFSVLSIKYFPIIRLRQKLFPFLFK
ncbi:Glycosyltransferase involved in cell wall bisynthesis [Flaviramulus basaltis]|uniref:Glycosyltransferase involved in cell wall bisynthesis n=1 Tax=Flaviramulus basaltis TaxID=369401 RepID=A0A1K2IL69_9FLAO|nr:glycosyltransferase family 2 protein [Flaviramulus basaltis]SFZ92960.1 Glycosyltransferase involved in cell wall bisynthesis [Flaviramulus basaltis]